ncbi:MAG: hypothetical protein IJW34_05315 [Clostridia bacterium]|nr:hypothetical protein [Clostridia bacterium]MBQ9794345.1 hypothetical protein [Clostridia bacterium]
MKKWFLVALCAMMPGLCACGMQVRENGSCVSSVGVVSGVTSVPEEEPTKGNAPLTGEYLSVEGDGEILRLKEDGTFLSYTVSDLTGENAQGAAVPYVMTERISGTYEVNDDGTVSLKLEQLTLKVDGLEEEKQLVSEFADVFAGEDQALHNLYERLFGGEEIGGEELLGEEAYAQLKATAIRIKPDKENASFTYVNTQE